MLLLLHKLLLHSYNSHGIKTMYAITCIVFDEKEIFHTEYFRVKFIYIHDWLVLDYLFTFLLTWSPSREVPHVNLQSSGHVLKNWNYGFRRILFPFGCFIRSHWLATIFIIQSSEKIHSLDSWILLTVLHIVNCIYEFLTLRVRNSSYYPSEASNTQRFLYLIIYQRPQALNDFGASLLIRGLKHLMILVPHYL